MTAKTWNEVFTRLDAFCDEFSADVRDVADVDGTDEVEVRSLRTQLDDARAAEMDESVGDAERTCPDCLHHVDSFTHQDDCVTPRIRVAAACEAAQATLADVRAEHQPKSEPCCDCSKLCVPCALECASCEQQSPCNTIRILDRSTP